MGIENKTIESLTALSKSNPRVTAAQWFAALEEEYRKLIHLAMEISGVSATHQVIASDEKDPFPFSEQTLRRYQNDLRASNGGENNE
ncbi:hypothetical protein [Corynebacterium casei]|uniref:hypothetical protein n=1 Tax=Corynebacterium casei TaxID=160386 RepID=UPI003FD0CB65